MSKIADIQNGKRVKNDDETLSSESPTDTCTSACATAPAQCHGQTEERMQLHLCVVPSRMDENKGMRHVEDIDPGQCQNNAGTMSRNSVLLRSMVVTHDTQLVDLA